MKQVDREKYTYEAVESDIRDLERQLADYLVDNVYDLDKKNFNTVAIILKIGGLKALRNVFWKRGE